jgi:hypothetical protein
MLKFTTYCVLPKTDFRFIIFEMGKLEDRVKLTMNFLANSPFAPSDANCLNFKLHVESRPQSQPL